MPKMHFTGKPSDTEETPRGDGDGRVISVRSLFSELMFRMCRKPVCFGLHCTCSVTLQHSVVKWWSDMEYFPFKGLVIRFLCIKVQSQPCLQNDLPCVKMFTWRVGACILSHRLFWVMMFISPFLVFDSASFRNTVFMFRPCMYTWHLLRLCVSCTFGLSCLFIIYKIRIPQERRFRPCT